MFGGCQTKLTRCASESGWSNLRPTATESVLALSVPRTVQYLVLRCSISTSHQTPGWLNEPFTWSNG